MGRWEPNARGRLEQAAMKLFMERGYDQVTTAQIAVEAGLTERSFFRYFTDKREVLFARGAAELRELFHEKITATPASASPLDVMASAIASAGALFLNREQARQRQLMINNNVELQERELMKLSVLSGTVADALRERGLDDLSAQLSAETGIALFKVAFQRWLDATDDQEFGHSVQQCIADLRMLTAPSS